MPPEATAASCPGCGAPVTGNFCANCGQRATGVKVSLGTLLREVLEDQFGVSGTLPRTLRALVFKPGFLTNEYLGLRLSPYLPPFRLYVVTSLLFFLVVGLRATLAGPGLEPLPAPHTESSAAAPTPEPRPATRTRYGLEIDMSAEDWAERATVNLGNARLNEAVRARLLAVGDLPPEQAVGRMLRSLLENAPKVMFLLLPLYALVLKLLYVRGKRLYVEHFIFALHVHAFVFAVFLIMAVLPVLPPVVQLGILLLPMVYTWAAMRRVYRQGRVKSTVKWLLLHGVYSVVIGLSIVAAMIAGLPTA